MVFNEIDLIKLFRGYSAKALGIPKFSGPLNSVLKAINNLNRKSICLIVMRFLIGLETLLNHFGLYRCRFFED